MTNNFSLVIGENLIRVIDVGVAKNKITVLAAAYDSVVNNIYTDNSGKIDVNVVNKIVRLVNDAGVTKRQVNIIIPDGFSYTRIIDMPMLSDKELLSAKANSKKFTSLFAPLTEKIFLQLSPPSSLFKIPSLEPI